MDQLTTNNSYETTALHTPFSTPDPHHALSMPQYNTVAFEFESAQAMQDAFCGISSDHTYSRISNPTVGYFEERVKAITDAHSVTALNSGMAAISNTLLTIAYAGSNIITSSHLFGNSYSLITNTLGSFGVEARLCDLTDIEAIKKQIDAHTCCLFVELITNPQQEVVDLKQLSSLTNQAGIPLIVDSTIVPFCSFNAKAHGVNIDIVSSTKYISGGATSLGGLILDYGTYDWKQSPKLNQLAQTAGHNSFTLKLKKEIHRNLGAYMTPQVAYMQTLGLETLQLRYQRQSATCLALAQALLKLPQIHCVNYTGLSSSKFHAISKAQFGACPGAMLTLDLADQTTCFDFLDRLKLIKRATNLFDNKTLAIHPATTIFGTFTELQRASMDIFPTTIRLSIGLEFVEELLADIKQALA